MIINRTYGGHILRIAFGISLLVILLLVSSAGAVPVEEWNKTFGGKYGAFAYSVQQTSDGGYILAGNAWLVKTDANGIEQWNKTFGGNNARSVRQTSDGGYILAGYTGYNGDDAWLIKTGANGTEQWNKTFGGTNYDSARSVRQTSDGGYILAGDTFTSGGGPRNTWLIKTDANGIEQWNKTFGGTNLNSIQQTSDGGYILAGDADGAWLIKTDANGVEQWNKTFGIARSYGITWASANSVQQTSDGGYILAGYTGDYAWKDAWLIKTNANGIEQWNKTFGGTDLDYASSVQQTSDGGYIVTGDTFWGGGWYIGWLVKTDTNGMEQWNKTFDARFQNYDNAVDAEARHVPKNSVQQTSDGGYIVTGDVAPYNEQADARLIKFSTDNVTTSPISTQADLSISSSNIKPIQVVENADINNDGVVDLVYNKSTVVRVKPTIGHPEALANNVLITVRLLFQGNQTDKQVSLNDLQANNGLVDFYFTPKDVGDSNITITIDPYNTITEENETNNQASKKVTVKETSDLNIQYVKIIPSLGQCIISCLFEPPNPINFTKTVEQSNKFITATYPIRDSGINYELREDYISKFVSDPKNPCLLPKTLTSCFDDLNFLSILAFIQHKDKIIGIADESYFENPHVKGFANPDLKNAAILAEGYYTAAAHEIGHSFGLYLKEEEYKVDATGTVTYPGDPAKGFWVGEKKEIENAISFMGTATTKGTFLNDRTKQITWVSNKDYSDLFNQLKKRDAKDPNILLINGFISKNDTIEFGDWYYLENREIVNNSQGNYSVELLDKNGQIIDKSQFDINFFMFVEPLGKVDIDTKSFIFPVSYPENTLKVQIKHDDKIIAEINPNAKLLHDAINLTPDKGFIDNPEQRRNDLHNKIKKVENQINEGNITDAKNKLEFDVKDNLEKWLVDDYQKETPFQLSKSEILNIVNNSIVRLTPTLPVGFTTDKDIYAQGEQVIFTFINNGTNVIDLPNSAPWWVENATTGERIFSPNAAQVITQVAPGKSQSWTWDQNDSKGKQVQPGTYRGGINSSIGANYTKEFEIVAAQLIISTPTPTLTPLPTIIPTPASTVTPTTPIITPTPTLSTQLPPKITRVETFREGNLVFFRLFFTDPNNDTEGFGFRGAKGSRWAEETHPFSSPSYGRVSPGRIEYPFNLNCETGPAYESDIEAWIYDSAGLISPSVTVHLACQLPTSMPTVIATPIQLPENCVAVEGTNCQTSPPTPTMSPTV